MRHILLTYSIHCLIHIIFCLLDYYHLYCMYIFTLSFVLLVQYFFLRRNNSNVFLCMCLHLELHLCICLCLGIHLCICLCICLCLRLCINISICFPSPPQYLSQNLPSASLYLSQNIFVRTLL